MKKHIITIVAIVIASVTISAGRMGNNQPVEFQKISDNLYQINGGSGANTGVYIGDNAVLVIDAKMDKNTVDQVISGIAKLTDKPIKYLVNTHSDPDHVQGNQYFPQTVTIIAQENCRKEFFVADPQGRASQWTSAALTPFVPSITFKDKMDIYLGTKKVELWYFGVGHTTGDAVVYFPQEKTAFVADQLFIGRTQLIHTYKGGNLEEHYKTLARMLQMLPEAERFCNGHSAIADRKAVQNAIDPNSTKAGTN
jgi:cyclase